MVAPGFFRGQGWFSHGGVDRPKLDSGAEVDSRLAGQEANVAAFQNRKEPDFGPLALQMAPFPAMCFSVSRTASYS